jgi:hypothetical protein
MKKRNPPCIRGLKRFEKAGCPQKTWDGENGCQCWKKLIIAKRGNPLEKELKEQCIDLWVFEFQWANMGQNEAQINLYERLNNGLLMEDTNGQLVPKPDMVSLNITKSLIQTNEQREINSQNVAKRIIDSSCIELDKEKTDA